MNPFMMSNIFFGPMGMSMSPMCCSGISMPFYGSRDMLTFMNFPIFRNTASDYLLNPGLAMMQTNQSMMYGGSVFGNNFLPLFNNFPGMPSIWNPGAKTETDEEKKAREAKEAEAKKPEAKKAASLKKVFDSVKKLAENKNNRFPKIPDELIEKAKKAMEKETAKEQLDAMKEVMASIPEDVLRKTVLADDEVKKQLKAAGYNFNLLSNKYSIKGDDVNESDITHDKRLAAIRSDIESSTYNYTEFQNLSSQLNGEDAARILEFVSAWNSKYSEKLFDVIAAHIPDGKSEVKLSSAQNCVSTIANALVIKADEYDGYPEISRLRKVLSEKIQNIQSPDGASTKDRKDVFTKENIAEISKAFNELYARLRMQEALKVRDYIKSNDDFRALNEVKEGIINDDMIIEETMKDLEREGITNYPKVNDLDKPPVTEEIIISTELEAEDADEQYKDDAQTLVDDYLVDKKGILSKVSADLNVYQTKSYDKNGNGVKYYTVKDGKLIEVRKTAEGKFEASKDAKEVTAKEIAGYDKVISRVSNLLDNKAIVPVANKKNLFKATGADEYYAIVDNTFGKVKKSADLNKVEDLKAEDLEEFRDEDVKSTAKIEQEKQDEAEKDIKAVSEKVYDSVLDIDNDALAELDKITGISNDFQETAVKGYYHCKSKNRYYVYNQTTGKLDYLRGVTEISDTGYMIKDKKWLPCSEIINTAKAPAGSEELHTAIQNYAKDFAKDLNGVTSDGEYTDAKRRLNTFTSFTDAEYIVNFIKGYKAYGGFWSNSGMCKQIASEYGLQDGETHTDKESKRYYLKWIAIRMKEVVNKSTFSKRSAEYTLLDQIARGELLSNSISYTAEQLDMIIDKIIEAYNEKQS